MKIFDTSVLIEYLRGTESAKRVMRPAINAGEAKGSVLSRIEIEGAMRSNERPGTWLLFSSLSLEPVTDMIASRAGEFARQYRRSHTGIDLVDFVIAATVDVLEGELFTLNVKHFPMFRGLKRAF